MPIVAHQSIARQEPNPVPKERQSQSERDPRHSVNTQAAYTAGAEIASLLEDAMDLSTKLKIAAVMAAVLMAVVLAVPVPV